MASDLSLQIQEAVTSTIEISVNSSGISILKSSKATKQLLTGLNVVIINASFVFEKLTTNLKFVLPARTATMIAHAMLMENTPPLDTISDDVADAMKESITQICGTLQTVINGAEFEDLGKTSFSISDFEIIDGSDYQVVNTFILFKLLVGEDTFDYFIDFEDTFVPFIEELTKSDLLTIEESESLLETPSDDVVETNSYNDNEDDSLKEILESKEENVDKEEIVEETSTSKEDGQNIVDNSEPLLEDSEAIALAKKNKIIKIIIIILGSLLGILIIGFSVLLFLGYFDKKEVVLDKNATKEHNITKPTEESLVIADIKNKQIDFKLDMINEQKLNKELQYLTKYEILEEDIVAKFKKDEEDRLYKLKVEKLEEFALNNKEESLYKINVDNNDTNKKQLVNRFDDPNIVSQVSNDNNATPALDNESLMFIKIDPKKYKQYRDVVSKYKQSSTQVSICKDTNGFVNVYVGPLYLKTVINNIMNGAKQIDKSSIKDMQIITITRGEFNKMCDF